MIKHIPNRKCVACGEQFPQKTMIKVVKQNEEFFIDPTFKQNGRGAYVCKRAECIKASCVKKQFNRSFKTAIPESLYEELMKMAEDEVAGDE